MIKLDKINTLNQLPGHTDREAIVSGAARLTWGEFEVATRRLVKHFAGKNCRRVLFLSENRVDLVPMFAAFSTLGVSFTGVDYTASAEQVLHCAQVVDADAIVYSSANANMVSQLREQRPMQAFCLDTELAQLPADDGSAAAPAMQPQFESIAFTSGTTGFAKAVYRTKSFDAKRFADLIGLFGFEARQVFLATIPFYHVSVVGWARLALSLGGKVVIGDVENAATLARQIRTEHVTALLATPIVLDRLLGELQNGGRPADLNFIITGGKHFPQDLKERALGFFGPIVNEYYGTTETGVNAIATAADLAACPASSGRLLDGNTVVILGEDSRVLPEAQIGRVAIHSYQNMDRYLNGPNAETVIIGGKDYLVTADYGYLQDQRICLVNRTFAKATPLDLYGLEDRVRRLPGIADVFAVGAGPQSINLFVAREKRAPSLEPGDILATGLAGIHVNVTYVERIPYSLSGKVRTGELRAI